VDEVFEQLPLHPTELVESVYIDRTQDEEWNHPRNLRLALLFRPSGY
jgi:hypothetical protein